MNNTTTGFIYIIENIINGKMYIGKSVNLSARWASHSSGHRGSKLVHSAIQKYGKENFTFSIVEKCSSREELSAREKYWIKELDIVAPKGYNLTTGGEGGWEVAEETRNKISAARRGKKHSQEWKDKISVRSTGKGNPFYGKRHTDLSLQKMSMAHKGQKPSEEECMMRSRVFSGDNNPMYGKKHTELTRAKMSAAGKKKIFTEEHRGNMSLARRGRKLSEEHKEKIRRGNKGKVLSQETKDKISKVMLGKKVGTLP